MIRFFKIISREEEDTDKHDVKSEEKSNDQDPLPTTSKIKLEVKVSKKIVRVE